MRAFVAASLYPAWRRARAKKKKKNHSRDKKHGRSDDPKQGIYFEWPIYIFLNQVKIDQDMVKILIFLKILCFFGSEQYECNV